MSQGRNQSLTPVGKATAWPQQQLTPIQAVEEEALAEAEQFDPFCEGFEGADIAEVVG